MTEHTAPTRRWLAVVTWNGADESVLRGSHREEHLVTATTAEEARQWTLGACSVLALRHGLDLTLFEVEQTPVGHWHAQYDANWTVQTQVVETTV